MISGILLTQTVNDQLDTTRQTANAITDINAKLQLLTDAETGVRGYAATGDQTFLQPYDQAVTLAPAALSKGVPGASGVLTPSQTASAQVPDRPGVRRC